MPLEARLNGLAAKGCGRVCISANGAHALVVLVVEDEFFVRSDIADLPARRGLCRRGDSER